MFVTVTIWCKGYDFVRGYSGILVRVTIACKGYGYNVSVTA